MNKKMIGGRVIAEDDLRFNLNAIADFQEETGKDIDSAFGDFGITRRFAFYGWLNGYGAGKEGLTIDHFKAAVADMTITDFIQVVSAAFRRDNSKDEPGEQVPVEQAP